MNVITKSARLFLARIRAKPERQRPRLTIRFGDNAVFQYPVGAPHPHPETRPRYIPDREVDRGRLPNG